MRLVIGIDMANYKTFARFWNTFNHCMKKAMNRITFIWEILFSFFKWKNYTMFTCNWNQNIKNFCLTVFFLSSWQPCYKCYHDLFVHGFDMTCFFTDKMQSWHISDLHSWYISYNFLISKTKKQCNMHEGCVTQETHANTFSDRKRMISW